MRILGSVVVPVLLESDSRVRDVAVRVVEDLPYDFIFGADFFRSNCSMLEFTPKKGFRPVPSAPWVPFHTSVLDSPLNPLSAARDRFYLLTATGAPETPPPLTPPLTHNVHPSYHDIAWEDESTLEWDVRQVAESTTVGGFTSIAVETAAVGPQPQDRQLVLMLPTERFDLKRGALVGVARAVLWWQPGSPVYCKLVNRSKENAEVTGSGVIARMIALNVRDAARFESLFDEAPSAVDLPLPLQALNVPCVPSKINVDLATRIVAADANLGTLGALQKQQLISILEDFIADGLFPVDPKRVPACISGELELPLINESCTPFAAKQRRCPPRNDA